jgi:Outer membrane protein beta-barrel domain
MAFVWLVALSGLPLAAQSAEPRFQAGVQLPTSVSGEFDGTDVGIGGRLSWHPVPLLGVEGELAFYPGDFPDDPAFSASRVEGLFGATVGPRLGRLRPFAKLRPGFIAFDEAPAPFACILIFPPPLRCTMASGHTVFAFDLGGGLEWFPSGGTFVRVEAGDRAVRYPSPVIDGDGSIRDDDFFGHDFRFAIGGGFRF